VEERGPRPLLETLKDYLRPRYLLLLLDSFEQVLEAGPSVTDLLKAAPNLRVVVTSRAVLRVYGEHEYSVQRLRAVVGQRLADVGKRVISSTTSWWHLSDYTA
jgi:predicted ATPase